MTSDNYIRKSASNFNDQRREYLLYGRINVLIKDHPISEEVDIPSALQEIEDKIPEPYFHNVDAIYIGEFPELTQRDVMSAYLDGAVYTLNTHEENEDLVRNIVHEMAHSIEQGSHAEIYHDGSVENEFLGKRKKLGSLLPVDKEGAFDVSKLMNPDYDKEVDEYLWFQVGYPTLLTLSIGLFVTPYSATSLREYFAEGLEQFFIGDRESLATISPVLYTKIKQINEFLVKLT